MILISKHPYDINETLYSGQAFRWNKLNNTDVNEGIVEGTRIRVTQVEEGIHCEFGGGTEFDENSMEKYLRLDD
ncbi:MAG: DNA glycosylase, partial [Chloroflexota bacterium]|nr:DNA glycosylase [Chloroflexota bacterium]